MSWISSQFIKYWRQIHIGIVLVLSAVLILGPAWLTTFVKQGLLNSLYFPAYKVKATISLVQSQAAANEELRQSLVETSLKIAVYEEMLRENERLRAALGFEPPPGYTLVPAEVIAVSGVRLPVNAVMNRGDADQVSINQPVINEDGLVGRVVEVMPDYAVLQLLTDPANRVAARVASSREMGIVKYDASRGMILDNFPRHGSIAVGDTVVSSGLGGVYPPGLFVGVVTEVSCDEDRPFCEVDLRPAVNFHSIEELFILKVNKEQ